MRGLIEGDLFFLQLRYTVVEMVEILIFEMMCIPRAYGKPFAKYYACNKQCARVYFIWSFKLLVFCVKGQQQIANVLSFYSDEKFNNT